MHELSRIDIGRQVVYLIGFHRVSVAFPRKQLEASSLHLSPSLPPFLFPSSFSPFEFIAVLKASLPVSRRSLSQVSQIHRLPPSFHQDGRNLIQTCKDHRGIQPRRISPWKKCSLGRAQWAAVPTMKASPLLISWHNDNAPIYSVHFDPNGKGRLATAGKW